MQALEITTGKDHPRQNLIVVVCEEKDGKCAMILGRRVRELCAFSQYGHDDLSIRLIDFSLAHANYTNGLAIQENAFIDVQ